MGALLWESARAGAAPSEPVPIKAAPSKLASANQVNAIAGIGYGWGKDQGINRWKVGASAALGYTFANGAHIGIFFDYFWGETLRNDAGSTQGRYYDWGIGGGYDFAISQAWVFRLRGDVGGAELFTRDCVVEAAPPPTPAVEACASGSEGSPMLGAGASILYLGKWSFFTEVRELFAFPDDGHLVYATALLIGFWPPPYEPD